MEGGDKQSFATSAYDHIPNKWLLLFGAGNTIDLENLFSACINGVVAQSDMRAIAWRVALNILPTDVTAWRHKLAESRLQYARLLKKFDWNPYDLATYGHLDISTMNPLSQEPKSPWHEKFDDQERQAIIDHDVARTFSEETFFQSKKIRKTIGNILRIYGHANLHLPYIQGMHEVLAPIIYVISEDAKSYAYWRQLDMLKKLDKIKVELLAQLNDEKYQEHDAYTIFLAVMSRIRVFYACNMPSTPKPMKTIEQRRRDICEAILQKAGTLYEEDQIARENEFLGVDNSEDESEFFRQLRHIHYGILDRVAPQLQRSMEERRITLATFAPKWLRVLFGREFASMRDILLLWDALFASANAAELQLVDYVYVALLIDVHDVFVKGGDEFECMNAIRNHSKDMTVRRIVQLALALKWPEKYKMPVEYERILYDDDERAMRSRVGTTSGSSKGMAVAQSNESLASSGKSGGSRLKRTATAFGDLVLSKFKIGSQTRVANAVFYSSLATKTIAAKAAAENAKNEVERRTICQMTTDEMLSHDELSELVKEQIARLQLRVYELEDAKCNSLVQLVAMSQRMTELFNELQLKLGEAESVSSSGDTGPTSSKAAAEGESNQRSRQEMIEQIRREIIAELNKIANLLVPNMPASPEVQQETARAGSSQNCSLTPQRNMIDNRIQLTTSPIANSMILTNHFVHGGQMSPSIVIVNEPKQSDNNSLVQEMQPTAGRFCKSEIVSANNSVEEAVEVDSEISLSPMYRRPTFDQFAWAQSNWRRNEHSPQPNSSSSYKASLRESEGTKDGDDKSKKADTKKKKKEDENAKKPVEMVVIKDHTKIIIGSGEGKNERIAEAPQDLGSDLIQPAERSRAPTLPRGDVERRRNF